MPKEHGLWSLVLEPLALGLLVAPSFAGVALATAAFAGFLARRPMKVSFAPENSAPRRAARGTVLIFSVLAMAGLFEAVMTEGGWPLWPLLFAAPLAGFFACFDAQGDSRAIAAELAGSSAFAFLPAALATLAGWPVPAALALAVLSLTRSIPTVLTVRTYLRLRKGQPAFPLAPLLTASLGLGAIILLAVRHEVPWLAVSGAVLLLVRTGWLMTSRRPLWPARRMGITEAVLGGMYVALLAVAYWAEI